MYLKAGEGKHEDSMGNSARAMSSQLAVRTLMLTLLRSLQGILRAGDCQARLSDGCTYARTER